MRCLILAAMLLLIAAPVINGATHIIGYGDTLWDLSIHYYGTPDLWVNILNANEHVEDQYSLIPGQVLLIPGISRGMVYTSGSSTSTIGYYNASAEALLSRLQIETAGMVAVNPVVPLGYVLTVNAEEEGFYRNEVAIPGDLLEIDLGADAGVVTGNVYHILEPGEFVDNPETGRELGQVMRVAGVCRVIGTTPSTSIVKLEHAYIPIVENDLIVPYRAAEDIIVNNVPVISELEVNVLAFRNKELLDAYTFNVIYLDCGTNDGVSPGDVFSAYKYGRTMYAPGGRRVIETADIPIADVVILSTELTTCAALVALSRTANLIQPGDALHLASSQLD